LTVFRETASRTEKGLIARCQGTVVLLVDTGTPAIKPFLAGAIAQNSLLAFRGLSCLNNFLLAYRTGQNTFGVIHRGSRHVRSKYFSAFSVSVLPSARH